MTAPAHPAADDDERRFGEGFEQPSAAIAVWQIVNSLVPYLGTMALMYLTIRHGLPWWTTLALAAPASGFMVRLFILMEAPHALRERRAGLPLRPPGRPLS